MRKKITYILSNQHLAILSFILFLTSTGLYATNHIINFGGTLGNNYSPTTLNVAVGDTITWEGTFSTHPLSSTSVPQDAATFHNGTGSAFSYLVQAPGNYNYECDVHAFLGMNGSFTATVSSVENDLSAQPEVFRLEQNYPNPFNPITIINYQ